ncbi:NAD(P)-dependent oxidoreductase [Erwinia sorbitola]|uniref:NAD-binding protein n=1 Tax=Erwinia sorbitola TaxID=2681984 RepID=A0A6I6EGB3_9GAMM|nr:NAD(P)-dependent oxidoreductase [Erwinia sorbitola]MTD25828.1 NAD-binding protein [Erwinia sorbitola]QGU87618.1 NAD-binding protein [Erwinia sorbitola]
MKSLPSVAVLGLGAMGHAFAANLLKKSFHVYGWNRTRARGEDLIPAGLTLCDTREQAVADADVVIVMLSDGATTLATCEQILPLLKPDAVLCQMGTIGVDATQQLINSIHTLRPDVVLLDAPVSGTKTPAEQAQILVLASGDRQRAAAIEPVFAAIAKGTKWLGEAGAGSKMKLVANAWLVSIMQGVAESTQLAQQFGFTPDDFWQVLDGGPLAAPYVKGKLAMISAGEYPAQMQLTWALKDAQLALDAAGKRPMPMLQSIATQWQGAVDAGYGAKDLSVVYRYLHEQQKK